MSIQLKNLKASFIFKENLLFKEKQSSKKVIFKFEHMTFTIYKHTPTLLNVTGVRSLEELINVKLLWRNTLVNPQKKLESIIHSL